MNDEIGYLLKIINVLIIASMLGSFVALKKYFFKDRASGRPTREIFIMLKESTFAFIQVVSLNTLYALLISIPLMAFVPKGPRVLIPLAIGLAIPFGIMLSNRNQNELLDKLFGELGSNENIDELAPSEIGFFSLIFGPIKRYFLKRFRPISKLTEFIIATQIKQLLPIEDKIEDARSERDKRILNEVESTKIVFGKETIKTSLKLLMERGSRLGPKQIENLKKIESATINSSLRLLIDGSNTGIADLILNPTFKEDRKITLSYKKSIDKLKEGVMRISKDGKQIRLINTALANEIKNGKTGSIREIIKSGKGCREMFLNGRTCKNCPLDDNFRAGEIEFPCKLAKGAAIYLPESKEYIITTTSTIH